METKGLLTNGLADRRGGRCDDTLATRIVLLSDLILYGRQSLRKIPPAWALPGFYTHVTGRMYYKYRNVIVG